MPNKYAEKKEWKVPKQKVTLRQACVKNIFKFMPLGVDRVLACFL